MSRFPYPPSPLVNAEELVKVKPGYRAQAVKVLFSILLFIAGYLAVLAGSVFLIYGGILLAGGILTTNLSWLSLILAIGVLMVVFMFFAFIIKFLFKSKNEENPAIVELSREDQPVLFEFIEKVCEETKAPFPKKIVVSAQVNACVYYNSSFLSMFFPVRKNLEIGLGLVSSVNLSEFKAIIAHEFGHFSQSSTRLGSYVYRFNVMVHNLLYDNTGWTDTLNTISSWHYFMRFFAHITVYLAKIVLEFFIILHKIINLSYMALSREMEFHADSVAISVSGNKPIISALHRLEFAQMAYHYTLRGIYNHSEGKDVRYPENFFSLLNRNITKLSRLNNLELDHDLPLISTDIAKTELLDSRIKFKDKWASHPTTEEREKNANHVSLHTEIIKNSPWELFSNAQKLQEQLSKKLIELDVKNTATVANQELIEFFEKNELENEHNEVYNDFYTHATNTSAIPKSENYAGKSELLKLSLQDLFSNDILYKLKRHNKNLADLEVLKNIKDGHIDTRKFEFDGKLYSRGNSVEMYGRLNAEIEKEEHVLTEYKQKISDWFYVKAVAANQHTLAQEYLEVMTFRKKVVKDHEPVVELLKKLTDFYHKELTQSIDEDSMKYLRERIAIFYKMYSKIKDELSEEGIPTLMTEKSVLKSTGYKETVFETYIKDPNLSVQLDGFIPFVNAVEELLEHWSKIDHKAFALTLEIQDKILASGLQ